MSFTAPSMDFLNNNLCRKFLTSKFKLVELPHVVDVSLIRFFLVSCESADCLVTILNLYAFCVDLGRFYEYWRGQNKVFLSPVWEFPSAAPYYFSDAFFLIL